MACHWCQNYFLRRTLIYRSYELFNRRIHLRYVFCNRRIIIRVNKVFLSDDQSDKFIVIEAANDQSDGLFLRENLIEATNFF